MLNTKHYMVQYALWPNCNNNCKFCLRMNREVWSKKKILLEIRRIRENLDYIDWKDKFADGINRLEDLKIDCNKKMEDLIVKKFAIDQKIENLEQPYRNILFFRYTRGKSWEKVAEDLGYTKDYTCELHGKALYLYSKI